MRLCNRIKIKEIVRIFWFHAGSSEKSGDAHQRHSAASGSRGKTNSLLTSSQSSKKGNTPGVRRKPSKGKDGKPLRLHLVQGTQQAQGTAAASHDSLQRETCEEAAKEGKARPDKESMLLSNAAQVAGQPGMQQSTLPARNTKLQQPSSQPMEDEQKAAELPSMVPSSPAVEPAAEHSTLPSPDRRLSQKNAKRRSLRESSENSRSSGRRLGERPMYQMSCDQSLTQSRYYVFITCYL